MSAPSSSSIRRAPDLIALLLSSPSEGRAQWREGRLEPTRGTLDAQALADLVTLDVASRPDLGVYFEREDLSDTLAASFDRPNATWIEVLDSFFTLWRRHAFSVNLDTHAHRLEAAESRAAQVLAGLQARLASVSA